MENVQGGREGEERREGRKKGREGKREGREEKGQEGGEKERCQLSFYQTVDLTSQTCSIHSDKCCRSCLARVQATVRYEH